MWIGPIITMPWRGEQIVMGQLTKDGSKIERALTDEQQAIIANLHDEHERQMQDLLASFLLNEKE